MSSLRLGFGLAAGRSRGRNVFLPDRQRGDRLQQLATVAEGEPQILEVVVGEVGQNLQIDVIPGERLGVSAEAQVLQPTRNVAAHVVPPIAANRA